MPTSKPSFSAAQATIAALARPARIDDHGPIAARFLYSLRLIALHERVNRDPIPELTQRLGSVETAARSLALAQTVKATWPEDIRIGCYCCQMLTHDEATIAKMIDCASQRERAGFEGAVQGFIRHDRVHRLWDGVLGLIAAEMRSL
ncbi:DNA-directed RNA polymerase beta' subunit [Erythrobacter sp. NAP1]|uniref:hypothetical protein n=1 Tax=Erythrobacter sp. NAP1 TaxID=237727 RepID=UPI00006878BA|nr:hypothetical protein [Erythrobacter sp. NAP1]EAQ28261.1 DNA-directed RNA polymerase beta' subunit [Erythrobacter sp. NAP1]